MNSGKQLVDLAKELERQQNSRRDFLAPVGKLTMVNPAGYAPELSGLNGHSFGIRPWAHQQIAEFAGIPKSYYDRMMEDAPNLLSGNVNHWFAVQERARRTVRTLDGDVRAFLSDRYRPLENVDLANAALPVLQERGAEILSCELTERRLYIKATLPTLQAEIGSSRQKGDVVQAGLVISNSEVGAGAVRIEPMVYRLVCLNGMIAPDASMRKYHVGRGQDFDGIRELLADETLNAADRAFWLQARDVIRGAFQEVTFRALVGRINEAAGEKIEGELPAVVELAVKKQGLPGHLGAVILRNLIEGADVSRWGLVNAITATANDQKDYELSTALERAGGDVLELPPTEWRVLSTAKN